MNEHWHSSTMRERPTRSLDWDPDLESQISKKMVHESNLADSHTILGGAARCTEDTNEERRWWEATSGESLLPPARRNGALTICRNDLEDGTSQSTMEYPPPLSLQRKH